MSNWDTVCEESERETIGRRKEDVTLHLLSEKEKKSWNLFPGKKKVKVIYSKNNNFFLMVNYWIISEDWIFFIISVYQHWDFIGPSLLLSIFCWWSLMRMSMIIIMVIEVERNEDNAKDDEDAKLESKHVIGNSSNHLNSLSLLFFHLFISLFLWKYKKVQCSLDMLWIIMFFIQETLQALIRIGLKWKSFQWENSVNLLGKEKNFHLMLILLRFFCTFANCCFSRLQLIAVNCKCN